MTATKPTAMITLAGLRRLTEAAPGELENMIATGALPALDGDKLPMIESVQAFLHFLRNESRNASASAAMARARDARAEASELALAIARRDLVQDTEAAACVDYLCGVIAETFGGLPARITRDLRKRRLIEDALRRAQEAIASDLAQLPD